MTATAFSAFLVRFAALAALVLAVSAPSALAAPAPPPTPKPQPKPQPRPKPKPKPTLHFGHPLEALDLATLYPYPYAFSRDGTRIYTDATFYTVGGGSQAAGSNAVDVSTSPEASWTDDGRIFGWDDAANAFGLLAPDGSFTAMFSASAGGSDYTAISGDGSVAVGGSPVSGGEQLFVDRNGAVSTLTPTPTSSGDNAFAPSVSGDGSVIAWVAFYAPDTDTTYVYSSVNGAPASQLAAGWLPTVSPDDASIAFIAPDAAGDAQLWIVPSSGGSPTQLTTITGGIDPDAAPSWSADGGFITVADEANTNVYVVNATGRRPPTVVASANGVTSWVHFPQFSPDGSKLGYAYEGSTTGSEIIYYLPVS
jgi:WD40 repeat protein